MYFHCRTPASALALLVLMVAVSSVGCDAVSVSPAPSATALAASDPSLSSPDEVRSFYRGQLASITQFAASQGVPATSGEAVLGGSQTYFASKYGPDSGYWGSFSASFSSYSPDAAEARAAAAPASVRQAADLLESVAASAATTADFLSGSQDVYNRIQSSVFSTSDRQAALSYIVVVQETVRFWDENQSGEAGTRTPPQCLLGVLGGGISGAVAGAYGGVVGATAGALGGILLGAAEFCFD